MSDDSTEQELLELNQKLLDAIADGDWAGYVELCDPSLSCFEPEARGQLVTGLEFHQFYFDGPPGEARRNVTMASPHVRLWGDAAVVSYVRLVQKQEPGGAPETSRTEETRVWQRMDGRWWHVHFHRSTGS